jgi:hypothetical protein
MNALRIRKKLNAPIPELPELTPMVGKNVEIIVMEDTAPLLVSVGPASMSGEPKPIGSLEELRSRLPGDPFGPDFESTIREWRNEPWRSGEQNVDE